MCGLYGYAGNINEKTASKAFALLKQLAITSEARGIDATGFAARHDSGFVVADKLPCRATRFIEMSHKFRQLETKMPSTFIGHTRLGTGSSPMINNNNHPFLGADYHMVHNGVIPSWLDHAKEHKLDMRSETDSEIILRILEKKIKNGEAANLVRSVEWLMSNIWGNMAVALLDRTNPHVWLFRNDNPICIFKVPSKIFGETINFFASTESIFQKAWKEVFRTEFKTDGVSSRLIRDHVLFRLSTIPVEIEPGKAKTKFVNYKLNIPFAFVRGKQYYGNTAGASDIKGRTKVTKPVTFWSSVTNPDRPELGCHFSRKVLDKLNEEVRKKNGLKRVIIDGLSVKEYTKLKTLINDLHRIEKSGLAIVNAR